MFFWKRKRKLILKLIHVEPAMSGIFCFGREGIDNFTPEESHELLKTIQTITVQPISYINPWEWEIPLEDVKLSTFPLDKILHQEISAYMPSGKDASQWNRWMTEAQMLLHTHPINQKREALNQKIVNWIWIERS